jgi:hypothetical protein
VTTTVCAVVAGYRSIPIAEWIADVPAPTAVALGIAADRRPSEAVLTTWCTVEPVGVAA